MIYSYQAKMSNGPLDMSSTVPGTEATMMYETNCRLIEPTFFHTVIRAI